jgi:hypothetical protein
MEEQVEKLLHKAIYEWVKENFGQSEADEPSWNIEALAKALSHGILKYDIYRAVERDYLREDCKMIAEEYNIELTDKEVEVAVDEFADSEAYAEANTEDWLYFIHKVKGDYDN